MLHRDLAPLKNPRTFIASCGLGDPYEMFLVYWGFHRGLGDLLAISKMSPTDFGTSRQSLETFQVDFRDVRDRFWRCFGHASSVWQWTLMIPQYDHLSHPYFSYYFESKSEPIQVVTQNMGGVWWILICVSGDLTIVFLDIITSNKVSMSTN